MTSGGALHVLNVMARQRLDKLVVELGLAESREKAQALISAGLVRVDGNVAAGASKMCEPGARVELERGPRYVSRGGEKLDAALEAFGISVKDLVCLDVGASTGGFTDCMLQRGALRVYAVDVGKGQLHWKLRNDPRVVVMEGVNARYLKPADIPEQAAFAAMDVSFISLTKVAPAVIQLLQEGSGVVALIKPQFEAGRREVGKGGVVRDHAVRERVVEEIRAFVTAELQAEWVGARVSPLRGPAGNVEFLAHWRLK